MKFVLSMTVDNAAFQPDPLPAIADRLRYVAEQLDGGETAEYYRNITDVNGNIVGTFKLLKEESNDAPQSYRVEVFSATLAGLEYKKNVR